MEHLEHLFIITLSTGVLENTKTQKHKNTKTQKHKNTKIAKD